MWALLDLMSDEMIYEWSYDLKRQTGDEAQQLHRLLTDYLAG